MKWTSRFFLRGGTSSNFGESNEPSWLIIIILTHCPRIGVSNDEVLKLISPSSRGI